MVGSETHGYPFPLVGQLHRWDREGSPSGRGTPRELEGFVNDALGALNCLEGARAHERLELRPPHLVSRPTRNQMQVLENIRRAVQLQWPRPLEEEASGEG